MVKEISTKKFWNKIFLQKNKRHKKSVYSKYINDTHMKRDIRALL